MSYSPLQPEQARTDRQVEIFLQALNGADAPPVESLPPAQARQVLIDAQKSVAIDMSGVDESEQIITVDGQPLSLNIVRPANTDGVLPAFVFFHGGGWVLGDYFTHKRLVRDLVVASGVVGIFVNYTPRRRRAIRWRYGKPTPRRAGWLSTATLSMSTAHGLPWRETALAATWRPW